MRPIRALCLATILAAGACGLSPQDPTLEITVYDGGGWAWWPPGQDTVKVEIVNGLDDPRGLAGLELGVGGALPNRVFAATDLAGAADAGENPLFGVPDAGIAVVTARLVQDGQVVAEGTEEWTLEPEVEWELVVTRAPWPSSEMADMDPENTECWWWWCHRIWRFPIVEEAANYELEALWVTLYRVYPDECADVCTGWW